MIFCIAGRVPPGHKANHKKHFRQGRHQTQAEMRCIEDFGYLVGPLTGGSTCKDTCHCICSYYTTLSTVDDGCRTALG